MQPANSLLTHQPVSQRLKARFNRKLDWQSHLLIVFGTDSTVNRESALWLEKTSENLEWRELDRRLEKPGEAQRKLGRFTTLVLIPKPPSCNLISYQVCTTCHVRGLKAVLQSIPSPCLVSSCSTEAGRASVLGCLCSALLTLPTL